MNNPFLKTISSRLLYTGIWVLMIIAQILLLRYYFSSSDKILWQCILCDSLVCNPLQAICLLVLWYPIQYYRNRVSVPLVILFHLLLFILFSTIWLVAGYLITQAVLPHDPLYLEFFLLLLPARLFFGLFVYVLFTLAYRLFLTGSMLREQKETKEEAEREANPVPVEKLSRISVKKRQEIRFIPVHQIQYIEANGDYVLIYTDGDKYLKDRTMKYMEIHLPAEVFVRIHRSFIVNIEWIANIELYEKETYKVRMKNGNHLKVSSTGYKLLKQKMQL